MFLLIPAIFIFLLLAYIYLNDVSLVNEIIIYTLIVAIILLTYLLYKKIQADLKQQEINKLQAEIFALEKRAKNTQDEVLKQRYLKQIESINKEIDSKLEL